MKTAAKIALGAVVGIAAAVAFFYGLTWIVSHFVGR